MTTTSSSIGTTTLCWVPACSTVVEHSQQEGFYRVPLPAARQTPNLGDKGFRAFQLSPQEAPTVWSDASGPSSGRWNCGREMAENFAESGDFHVTFGFFYTPFYFPSEGRRAEDFFARKLRRLRPGLNTQTWVPKASTLPLDHRSRQQIYCVLY
jgi:hypothetical protein